MKTTSKITIDNLTNESVSIKTEKYITEAGQQYSVGQPHRVAYVNSESGREQLQTAQAENIANAVFAVWGNEPIVQENEAETK